MFNYAEVTIRRAELGEVDTVRKIIEDAYKPIKKKLTRVPGALAEDLGKISRQIQMGNVYVALVGEQIVGTMRVSLRGQRGVIERLAVRQDFRDRRIGTMMVNYAENLLDHMNATCVEIEVYGNVDYQGTFYKNLGYGEIRTFVRRGEEIIVMFKDLNEPEVEEEPPL